MNEDETMWAGAPVVLPSPLEVHSTAFGQEPILEYRSQILTLELRGLEEMAVLQRRVSTEGALKVEYKLTDLGKRSEPILRQLISWGTWFCAETGLEYDWPMAVC